MQTVADILIAPTWLESLYFNAQCISSYRADVNLDGKFYDIDCGADSDYALTDTDCFYDRKALTEYINGLY